MKKIQIKTLHPMASLQRGSDAAAGFDLRACIDEPVVLRKGEPAKLIPTGLAVYIEDSSIMGLIAPRSGLGHKQGLVLGNTVGVVDADYQNQWFVSAWNRGQQEEIVINPGERIAQAIFVPIVTPEFVQVDEFTSTTERGLGGFGSTGVA